MRLLKLRKEKDNIMDNIKILIIGTDINAYYMARCYNEAYNKKAYLIGMLPMNFTSYSKILNISYEPNLHDTKTFKKVLKDFYDNHKDKKIVELCSLASFVRVDQIYRHN